jgi:RimJ/RimL family protein N-acetyltransferase
MLPPTYKTEHYSLEPYQPKDLERYLEMSLDKEVVAHMGGATGDRTAEEAMFQKIFELYRSNAERWFWVWAVYRDQELCAHLELKETRDTAVDELEIVYMVHPGERGKGIMKEVLLFLKANQNCWKRRITATVYPGNEKSFYLLSKWGIERQELITDNDTGETFIKVWLNK